MICRSCGAEIADKAIVCFRCGAPTAELTVVTRRPETRPRWAPILAMLVIIALGIWLIPKTPPGSPSRILAWVVTWLVVFGATTWLKPRRPGR